MGPAPHSFGATVCAVRRDLSYREATLCALISWAVRLIERPNQVWCPTSRICRSGARRGARYSLISCAVWRSSGRTRSGAPTSHIYGDRARLSLPGGGDGLGEPAVDISFCFSALEQALARFGRPETHQRRLRQHAGGSGYSHLDGRPRPLDWRSSTRTFNSKAMPTAARRISASPPGRPQQALAAARQWRRGATASAVDSSTRLWR
jgi:hypothetical protein